MKMKNRKYLALAIAVSLGFALTACSSTSISQVTAPITETVSSPSIVLDSTRMMTHLTAFQKIAQANGGNRAVGTKGGMASAKYIYDEAKKAGLNVQMIPFKNEDKVVGQNILVEIAGQDINSVVMLGAHYDSVKAGPGINDNASGVALLLDLMRQITAQKEKPKQTIVLAFWDSEEAGIAGSQNYVKKLSPEQLKGIKAYINIDMVGTKNPKAMVFDASKSTIVNLADDFKDVDITESQLTELIDRLKAVPTHPQDIVLEEKLTTFFGKNGIVVKKDISTPTASDTAGFLGKVPIASIILFGQDKGEFAPCYHKKCDTLEHIDPKSLQIAGDAVTYLLDSLSK